MLSGHFIYFSRCMSENTIKLEPEMNNKVHEQNNYKGGFNDQWCEKYGAPNYPIMYNLS